MHHYPRQQAGVSETRPGLRECTWQELCKVSVNGTEAEILGCTVGHQGALSVRKCLMEKKDTRQTCEDKSGTVVSEVFPASNLDLFQLGLSDPIF